MPGYTETDGTETADQLARQGCSQPLVGHESALGIRTTVARRSGAGHAGT
jgi:hypothetical protein